MRRGRRTALVVQIEASEQATLTELARHPDVSAVLVRRARVLLLVAAGHRIVDVCAWTGMSRAHIYALARRWEEEGLTVVHKAPRRAGERPRRTPPWRP
jgi:hypothetical protein